MLMTEIVPVEDVVSDPLSMDIRSSSPSNSSGSLKLIPVSAFEMRLRTGRVETEELRDCLPWFSYAVGKLE